MEASGASCANESLPKNSCAVAMARMEHLHSWDTKEEFTMSPGVFIGRRDVTRPCILQEETSPLCSAKPRTEMTPWSGSL
jgi:hypothetical protein